MYDTGIQRRYGGFRGYGLGSEAKVVSVINADGTWTDNIADPQTVATLISQGGDLYDRTHTIKYTVMNQGGAMTDPNAIYVVDGGTKVQLPIWMGGGAGPGKIETVVTPTDLNPISDLPRMDTNPTYFREPESVSQSSIIPLLGVGILVALFLRRK